MSSFTIYRASQLYNAPSRRGQPGSRGVFNVGKSVFYEVIEPELERVKLAERAIGYTSRSVDKKIEKAIADAAVESGPRSGESVTQRRIR